MSYVVTGCQLCHGQGELLGRVALHNGISGICPVCRGSGALVWTEEAYQRAQVRERLEQRRRHSRNHPFSTE